jgi:hypothetical protein
VGRRHPARIPARFAIETAQALAGIAPIEFDGHDLPFRGAVDTTEMVLFAVTAHNVEGSEAFEASPEDEAGDPLPGVDVSEIPTGPAAVDTAGEAVEVASELASHAEALPGHMYISKRTDEEAAIDRSAFEYLPRGESGVTTRVI